MKLLMCVLLTTAVVFAEDEKKSAPPGKTAKALPTVEDTIKDLTHADGYFPLYFDHDEGKVLAEINEENSGPFIYATGLSSGLGSNPVGLDRGQWGDTRLCLFKRVGRRVFLIQQNTQFRASRPNRAERRAVQDSFADSIFWSTKIVARSGNRILIDPGSLLKRDAHQVVSRLRETGQGDYQFDADLSFVELERCRAFPRNSELNAMVTYRGKKAGRLVSKTAADGNTFSLRIHHSFVQLPEPGYTPRRSDPRVASLDISFADYSAPLDRPLEQRFISRHRLRKSDPAKRISPPVKPIIYYLDPGTPEPVRSALLDGARWWNDAFTAAGFKDAFLVKMLPEDADPMDVRYNVIQWVHRRTRGWSYGQSIVDPRTGEIIKGHVLLGSLRVRQDRLIIDGVTANRQFAPFSNVNACGIAAAGTGVDRALAMLDDDTGPINVSLARLRQLSAHEVGHTIGFSHNFAASTYADRASVMDYPAPRIKIRPDNTLDLSDAYGVGIGEWDKFMVRYAYSEFKNEREGLDRLLNEASERGMLFLSDADARPSGAANPLANLWDNGSDPVAELNHLMKVRQLALQQLDETDLSAGQSLSDLETVLVPIYLYHRYQIDAVAKMIGGFDYDYAVVGKKRKPVIPIAVADQKAALLALLKTLDASQLKIPEKLLRQLPPKVHSSARDTERFESRTSMIFDPDAAIRTAAELTLSQILQPERLARLAAYSLEDWNPQAVLEETLGALVLKRNNDNPHAAQIVERVLFQKLIALADNESTSHEVRAAATFNLGRFAVHLRQRSRASTISEQSHSFQITSEIERFQKRPWAEAKPAKTQTAPPGSPIGSRN